MWGKSALWRARVVTSQRWPQSSGLPREGSYLGLLTEAQKLSVWWYIFIFQGPLGKKGDGSEHCPLLVRRHQHLCPSALSQTTSEAPTAKGDLTTKISDSGHLEVTGNDVCGSTQPPDLGQSTKPQMFLSLFCMNSRCVQIYSFFHSLFKNFLWSLVQWQVTFRFPFCCVNCRFIGDSFMSSIRKINR